MIEDWNAKHVNQQELILEWRDNPVQAAREILGVDLDKHQRIVLNSRWQHSTEYDVLSRGCGKTFLAAVTGTLRCLLYPGHRVGFIGPSFRQSKFIFAEVEKLYERSPMFQQSCNGPKKSPESNSIKFHSAPGRSASWLEALPIGTDGSKIRGARFYDVYADEIAQVDDDVLNTVVRGFLATSADPMERVHFMREQREKIARGEMTEDQLVHPEKNKFIGSSTAFYQYNHLWHRVQNAIDEIMDPVLEFKARNGLTLEKALKKFPTHRCLGGSLNEGQIPHRWICNGSKAVTAFTYMDPSEGFMNIDSVQQARTEMSDYMFRMEYCAFFPPDSEGFFRRDTLNKTRNHNSFTHHLAPEKGLEYVMGIDPARTHDNFAISIFAVDNVNKKIMLVRVLTWNKKDFPSMCANVRKLIKFYGIKYFEMDAGGGGTTIRDLLANKDCTPPGERLILEQDFDEHRPFIGDRILGPLIQFSDGQWCHDANHNLLSGIQHGTLQIASQPENVPGVIYTDDLEQADAEMDSALTEMSSIIVTSVGSRMHWDTPTKGQRKDRYSAILVGYNAALKRLTNTRTALAMGFWA